MTAINFFAKLIWLDAFLSCREIRQKDESRLCFQQMQNRYWFRQRAGKVAWLHHHGAPIISPQLTKHIYKETTVFASSSLGSDKTF